MKKLLLSFIMIFACMLAKAQTYTFSQTSGTYTNLQSPSVLSQAGWDYMDSYNLALTFPFIFGNNTQSLIGIDGKGLAGFQFGASGILALATDLEDRAISGQPSTIGYEISGVTGNRILKIEWKNAGFVDGTSNDFINFQLWLYEGSNKIEMHYGTSAISSPSTIFFPYQGPAVGLTLSTNPNFTISGVFLQGNPANATMATINNGSTFPQLNAAPANGTIYTFIPATTTGLAKFLPGTTVKVYPNPTYGTLNIEGLHKAGTEIKVYDVLGKLVTASNTTFGTNTRLHLEDLKTGTYFIEIFSTEGLIRKQIIKQ